MNRLVKVSLILLATLGALAIGGVVYADGPASPPVDNAGATIIVGRVLHPVVLGRVIYAPEGVIPDNADGPAYCNTPPMTIKIDGSSGISGVTVSTDEDCVVSVTDIRRSSDEGGASGASDPTEMQNEGWAKSELNDRPGFDLATVWARMDYFYDGNTVSGGRNDTAFCDVWGYTSGWVVKRCSWTSGLTGPRQMRVRGQGNFSHGILGPIANH